MNVRERSVTFNEFNCYTSDVTLTFTSVGVDIASSLLSQSRVLYISQTLNAQLQPLAPANVDMNRILRLAKGSMVALYLRLASNKAHIRFLYGVGAVILSHGIAATLVRSRQGRPINASRNIYPSTNMFRWHHLSVNLYPYYGNPNSPKDAST